MPLQTPLSINHPMLQSTLTKVWDSAQAPLPHCPHCPPPLLAHPPWLLCHCFIIAVICIHQTIHALSSCHPIHPPHCPLCLLHLPPCCPVLLQSMSDIYIPIWSTLTQSMTCCNFIGKEIKMQCPLATMPLMPLHPRPFLCCLMGSAPKREVLSCAMQLCHS